MTTVNHWKKEKQMTPEEIKKQAEEKQKLEADAKQRERESAAAANIKAGQHPLEAKSVTDVKGSVTGAPSIGTPVAQNPQEQAKIDDKLRDKSPESVQADLSVERANPGREGKGTIDHEQTGGTVQREDGTITSTDHPDETAHYVGGTRVMLREEDKKKYDSVLAELNKLQDNRGISDINVDDPYWEKKKELDALQARMKR